MKELEYPYNECPHCHRSINLIDLKYSIIDVEGVEGSKYGVQMRWKEVYTCPHCQKQFYTICEH